MLRQNETTRSRAGEDREAGSDLVVAPAWVDKRTHRVREFRGLQQAIAVVGIPACEQLGDIASSGVLGLKGLDALNRVATTQRDQRVAAPIGPLFEAADRQL